MSKPVSDCWMLLVTATDCVGALYYFYDNWHAASKHRRHLEESYKKYPGIFHGSSIRLERMSGAMRSEFPLQYEEHNEKWEIPVDDLEFSVRTSNCLANANIRYVGDLVRWEGQELLQQKKFGAKCLTEVKTALKELGLTLGSRS